MSFISPCPGCGRGDHTNHVEHWDNPGPHILGGATCGCKGGCAGPDLTAVFAPVTSLADKRRSGMRAVHFLNPGDWIAPWGEAGGWVPFVRLERGLPPPLNPGGDWDWVRVHVTMPDGRPAYRDLPWGTNVAVATLTPSGLGSTEAARIEAEWSGILARLIHIIGLGAPEVMTLKEARELADEAGDRAADAAVLAAKWMSTRPAPVSSGGARTRLDEHNESALRAAVMGDRSIPNPNREDQS